MELVCMNCKQKLADVETVAVFNAAVQCGECGATVGHQFIPEEKPAPEPEPGKTGAPAAGTGSAASSATS
jgi:hypothetical protein